MHPRNLYRIPPNFSALKEFYPPLKPFVSLSASGNSSINFQNPEAQRALTQALLKRDFNITLSLPANRLCPTVPNRLNYILWIQDLLFPFGGLESIQPIRGLDIGTGASAIYPILGCTLSPSTREWKFVGTEIDPLSASFASKNVEANNLSSRIRIWPIIPLSKTDPESSLSDTILRPLLEEPESSYDFTVCNPPFYASLSEIESSAQGKELPPNAVCTGAETEMITPGGEAAFVLQMVRESAQENVKRRCRWFTSMLGKLSSVGAVVEEFRKLEVHNYALAQFVQGTTRRWAVGWSFGDERLPDEISRPTSSALSSYIPLPSTLRQSFMSPTHDAIRTSLSRVLASIENLTLREFDGTSHGELWRFEVRAEGNTWSRSARRKRKRSPLRSSSLERLGKSPRLESTTTPATAAFPVDTLSLPGNSRTAARMSLECHINALDKRLSDAESGIPSSVTLEIQWVRGIDRKLFESFWSHVCRKLEMP